MQPQQKTKIQYAAVSVVVFKVYGKHDYAFDIQPVNSKGLIKGKKLTYGYLSRSAQDGTKKGWYIADFSMTQDQFDRYWKLESGTKNVVISK